MTRIQSRPSKFVLHDQRHVDFEIDFEGSSTDENVQRALKELSLIATKVQELDSVEVPWFPTRIEDFDHIGNTVLGEGDGIQEADHPSFRDPIYRQRREFIANVALNYKVNDPVIPTVDYTPEELSVWKHCYPKLKRLMITNACDETNEIIREFE